MAMTETEKMVSDIMLRTRDSLISEKPRSVAAFSCGFYTDLNSKQKEVLMGKALNLIGQRFGKWTVIGYETYEYPSGRKDKHVICKCKCGAVTRIQKCYLVKNSLKTCRSCYRKKYEKYIGKKKDYKTKQITIKELAEKYDLPHGIIIGIVKKQGEQDGTK